MESFCFRANICDYRKLDQIYEMIVNAGAIVSHVECFHTGLPYAGVDLDGVVNISSNRSIFGTMFTTIEQVEEFFSSYAMTKESADVITNRNPRIFLSV